MSQAEIPSRAPFHVDLVEGENYAYCSCGRSQTQPFCDGAHKGTDFKPMVFVHEGPSNQFSICGCKHTKNPPFCDGAHIELIARDEAADDALERRFPSGKPLYDEIRSSCKLGSAVPDLPTKSTPEAVRYYAEVLGFEKVFDDRIVGFDHIMYACMGRGDFRVTLDEHRASEVDKSVQLYCYVDDVDALYREYEARGANIVEGLTDRIWQARDFSIHDLNGHRITFSMTLEGTGRNES